MSTYRSDPNIDIRSNIGVDTHLNEQFAEGGSEELPYRLSISFLGCI